MTLGFVSKPSAGCIVYALHALSARLALALQALPDPNPPPPPGQQEAAQAGAGAPDGGPQRCATMRGSGCVRVCCTSLPGAAAASLASELTAR